MKILMAQLNPKIGDLIGNTDKIISSIELGKEKGAELVVFPEMTVCGYSPDDLLLHENFIDEMESQFDRIVRSSLGIGVIVGLVRRNPNYDEKKLLNSAAIINDGKVLGFYDKWLLPTYDVFNERRYFARGKDIHVWEICNKRVGVVICEDMWQNAGEKISGTSYPWDPVKALAAYKPDLLINLTASPFQSAKADIRVEVCKAAVNTLKCPVVYTCQVGANGTVICDGLSLYLDKNGEIKSVSKAFEEDHTLIDTEANYETIPFEHSILGDMYDALVLGVKDYFAKSFHTKAIIGITGGLDASLVAQIAVKALGKENVLGIYLPGINAPKEQIKHARLLCKNLGMQLKEICLEQIEKNYHLLLKDHFDVAEDRLIEDNILMRIRATILMAFANKTGALLLATGNKTEFALGYNTLYGDMAGAVAVIGDVVKTNCYELAKYINREKEIIPKQIIKKPSQSEITHHDNDPSPLPSYDIVDKVIKGYVEDYKTPDAIAKNENIDIDTVHRIIRRIYKSEHKRRQAPPSFRVSKKSFAVGRKKPLHYRGSSSEKVY